MLHYFICGIGGSGMLPLAVILKGMGHRVSGSDRSYDQGRTPEKFQWIAAQGIALYPQDGSGIGIAAPDAVVISKAVEDTVPDIAAAKAANIPIQRRADILVQLFNAAKLRIAISGTSGKTTTTGMIAFLLKESGRDPTVMNGGIFRNYMAQNPYATAFVGKGDVFVTEVDESDGIDTVRQYLPDLAVIHNVTLDHQPMDELKAMFSGFLANTKTAVLNADDPLVMQLAMGFSGKIFTYGMTDADLTASDITHHADGVSATLQWGDQIATMRLKLPGAHNISNALAAIATCLQAGVSLDEVAAILARFEGIKRRMEVVGTANGITVMDDFAHNPDKIAATLSALKQFPGRVMVFFQPHGYGFLKMLGDEVAQSFAQGLDKEDSLLMVEPFYAGGTVDRSVDAAQIVVKIREHGGPADWMDGRDSVKKHVLETAKYGDRIVIMGARDDTLSDFAKDILSALS